MVKNPPANAGRPWVQSLGREDPLEEGTATHSSVPAWRIPWTEESGGLQPIGSQSRTRLERLSTRAPTQRSRTAVSKPGTQDLGPGSQTLNS